MRKKMISGIVGLGVALVGAGLALAEGDLSAKPKPSAVSSVSQTHPAGHHKAAPIKTAMGSAPAKAKTHRTSAPTALKTNSQPSHSGTLKPITNGK